MSCDAASEKGLRERELAVEKEKRKAAEAKVKDTQKRWNDAATWPASMAVIHIAPHLLVPMPS